jgi:hypothetical protein
MKYFLFVVLPALVGCVSVETRLVIKDAAVRGEAPGLKEGYLIVGLIDGKRIGLGPSKLLYKTCIDDACPVYAEYHVVHPNPPFTETTRVNFVIDPTLALNPFTGKLEQNLDSRTIKCLKIVVGPGGFQSMAQSDWYCSLRNENQ